MPSRPTIMFPDGGRVEIDAREARSFEVQFHIGDGIRYGLELTNRLTGHDDARVRLSAPRGLSSRQWRREDSNTLPVHEFRKYWSVHPNLAEAVIQRSLAVVQCYISKKRTSQPHLGRSGRVIEVKVAVVSTMELLIPPKLPFFSHAGAHRGSIGVQLQRLRSSLLRGQV
jgi:hypothetical protein